MIFQSNTTPSITPQKHDIFSFSYMKNITQPHQKPRITNDNQQKNSCFCFKSHKNHKISSNSDMKVHNLPDLDLKDEALKLSRQIAQKSFNHFKNVHLSPRNSFQQNKTLQTTKQSFQNNQKSQLSKNSTPNIGKKQQKGNQSEKDEFNMSRITFSVVNRSYEKTVNNTVSSNNTSMVSESNILGSMVSQVKNEGGKVRTSRQSHDESFSSISSITKRSSGKGLMSQLGSKKGIKVLKTRAEIEPIKEENEQAQTKKFRFIRVKAKDLLPMPKEVKLDKRLEIKKIQTEEKLQSSQQVEEEANVKYDYSSIVIDFFNMYPQTLEQMNQNQEVENILEPLNEENMHTNTNQPNNQAISFTPDQSSISRETSFSSLTSYNQVQSISNIKSTFAPSVSFDSNALSMSINNNFSECSFEHITKKQIRWMHKGYGGFDGLSCINENEESEVQGKNQSQSQIQQQQEKDQYSDQEN